VGFHVVVEPFHASGGCGGDQAAFEESEDGAAVVFVDGLVVFVSCGGGGAVGDLQDVLSLFGVGFGLGFGYG
jgi:hypothetical protein